jgi:hypothetical protein
MKIEYVLIMSERLSARLCKVNICLKSECVFIIISEYLCIKSSYLAIKSKC